MRCALACLVSLLLAAGAPVSARAQVELPIIDTHVHFNRETWSVYSPYEALALLDAAGVQRALVSSTPDDGTLRLYELAPDRIVPMLRPYRSAADFVTWTTDPSVVVDIEERLASGVPYRGIGEFELAPGQAFLGVPTRVVELAAERGLWLHVHAEPVALRELASLRGDVRILWAHAGVTAAPDAVAAVLDEHATVWVELSLRSDEIAPAGVLDPAWSAVLNQHAERVMLGSDTWVPSQWSELARLHTRHRTWLQQLPPDVARAIAHANAERLLAGN